MNTEQLPPLDSQRRKQGFALVIALSLMAFILLLLLSITTLTQVETETSSVGVARVEAEQAALLGLNVALGKIQEVVGVDQRVTANASILDSSDNIYTGGLTPAQGQSSWVGVWGSGTVSQSSSPDYSPASPDARNFIGWLVSATGPSGELELPTNLSDARSDVSGNPNSVTLYSNSDGTPYMQVEKILFDSSDNTDTYYAFGVEDESVKADLGWSETSADITTDTRYQANRLASLSGPDYSALNGASGSGPFSGSLVEYPLTIDDDNSLAFKSQKMSDIRDVGAVANSVDADWLKDIRGDITWGSYGVLSDVKMGGLRRDLSLAFEMDGEADISATDSPSRFNSQVGVFVGGNDRFASSYTEIGLPVAERYLWREKRDSGTFFSSDISSSASVMRGPTWWALRDYANLYKRLVGSAGNYSFQARAHYPNRSGGSERFQTIYPPYKGQATTWDSEFAGWNGDIYCYRPARSNYAPVLLGTVALISVLPDNGYLALGVDPIFYIWNPYNRTMTFDKLGIMFASYAFNGSATLWIHRSTVDPITGTNIERYGPAPLKSYFDENSSLGGTNKGISYFVDEPITMDPGEILVLSADPIQSSSGTTLVNRGIASLGLKESDIQKSGIIMRTLAPLVDDDDGDGNEGVPGGDKDTDGGENDPWLEIPFNPSVDQVQFNYNMYSSSAPTSERCIMLLSLPDGSINDASDMDPSSNYGEQLQMSVYHITPGKISNNGVYNYVSDSAQGSESKTPVDNMGPTSIAGKQFFGLLAILRRPTQFGFDPTGNQIDQSPVENFSLMNPLSMVFSQENNGVAHPNEIYMAVSSINSNQLYNGYGIGFPTGPNDLNGYWGESFSSAGSTHIPMLDIPSSPLISLAQFSNANFGILGSDPIRMVASSRANPYVKPDSIYDDPGKSTVDGTAVTAQDSAWLANDALFDRYYLSGFAPDFSLNGSYSQNGSLKDTIELFYGDDYNEAQANPVLRPYLPTGRTVTDIVNDLNGDDGYSKFGAYSMIQGAFNVNSTSVAAWEAFLRSNRNLAVSFANNAKETSSGVPFPSSASPVQSLGSANNDEWSGFSRLADSQISNLATEIVNQVKLRGPFMSLSDFVNRRTGTPVNNETHYAGALQAAIDAVNLNSSVEGSGRGVTPVYSSANFPGAPSDMGSRMTTSGVAKEINQADLLQPLAPRLTARGDTFRVRAYGEVVRSNGQVVKAICEAVVQRVPEYVNNLDDPWDEAFNPLDPSDSSYVNLIQETINTNLGRKVKLVNFRWIDPSEV